MNHRVIIACYDLKTKNILRKSLNENKMVKDVVECRTKDEVLLQLFGCENEPIVFCDKYFFGYKLKDKLKAIKRCNEKARICFCETGEYSPGFGARVYNLGADGYIEHIEKTEYLGKKIYKMLLEQRSFPEVMQRDIETNYIYMDPKSFSDVTDDQMDIGYYLGEGYRQKDIATVLKKTENNVHVQLGLLRQKIGYKGIRDFMMLNEVEYRIRHTDIWEEKNDCKG